MPERRRIVTRGVGGAVAVVLDLEDGVSLLSARDSLKVTPGPATAVEAQSPTRLGGSRRVGEKVANGSVAWNAYVEGASADAALANGEALLALLRDPRSDLFYEWRPTGATYSTYYEVRGSATFAPTYRAVQFAQTPFWEHAIEVPVGPVARFDPLDVFDPFDADTRGDYTFDAGVLGDLSVAGGAVAGAGTLTTERRLRHTARGFEVLDGQATLHSAPGSTITSYKASATIAADALNYVDVYVDDNGTNSRLRVDLVVAGVRTNRSSTNLAARVANGVDLWVRARREDNVVYAEYWSTLPNPINSPTLGPVAYLLTPTEQAALVGGCSGGWAWTPQQAGARVYDFDWRPFTYRFRPNPEVIRLMGPVPGTAPALVDVEVTALGSLNPWAVLAWCRRALPHNLCWNGDFEEDVNGWSLALVTGVQAVAGTSITWTFSATTKYGTNQAVVVTPASTGSGVNFRMFRRFKAGVPVTATLWVNAASSTTVMKAVLGVSGDQASSTSVALSPTLTQVTVTWTPAADASGAYLSYQTTTATATTFAMDGVVVYEGAVAPTLGRHAEGAGAVPPFGAIEAMADDTGDRSATWAPGASGLYRLGQGLQDLAVAGAKTYTAGWWIDPALMVPDDFSGELDVEFWWRGVIGSDLVSPRAVLSARPEWGTSFGNERFTAEWGAVGSGFVGALTSSAPLRRSRLGTITFPVDRAQPARWKLWLTLTTAAGSSGTLAEDYLLAVPLRARVASPSGKPNDSTYPKFLIPNAPGTRLVRSDLSGTVAKVGGFAGQPSGMALGGPPMEFPPGDVDVLVDLSALVPDDPLLATSTTSEAASTANASLHFAVTPRAYLVRGG